tara:strand:+ start:2344 stop:2730 length:387 start_codon:yes stop_codon:yes gene_type:complete
MIKKIMDETNTGFISYIGGLDLKKIDEVNYSFFTVVKEFHLNSGNVAHGGYLSTIADTGMGTAVYMATNKRCVTVSLELKFISPGILNQKLIGKIKIQKKTKSLVFLTCEISNTDNVVVTASGVWKVL